MDEDLAQIESQDRHWMRVALGLAVRAAAVGEVPVGAVLVRLGEAIGEGWNQSIGACDPTAHAEVIALRSAGRRIGNYRLLDSTLYVTLEPCPMCAGAIVQARIPRVVYGAADPKAGAVRSLYQILEDSRLNHRVEVVAGVLAEECGHLLTTFFQQKRLSAKK